MRDTEVVIAGAGPVGLLLACELRRAGVPVVIVERLATPMTESRASQLSTHTAELLHERDFDPLLGEAAREFRAHFGGLPLDLSGLDSEFAGHWKVPQYRTESVLGLRAETLGATLLRAHELSEITESGDHVICGIDGPAGKTQIRAQYLVGCDGASSTVRRLCGFTASVTGATRELLRADVTGLEIRDRRFERLEGGFAVAATRDGVTRVMVHGSGRGTVTRSGPPEFAEIAGLWEAVTGEDISRGNAIWADSFDNSRGQVTRYRRGRVFLAGDAAHWHMPIGGQALNVGLQDAVNLGWKLAGSVNGWAPRGLLDSYHDERYPVGARVLEYVAAQETLLLGGAEVEPLRAVLSEVLGLDRAREHLARVAGDLDIRYETGDGPLAGRRMPNIKLQNGSGFVTTADLLAGAGGILLRTAHPDRASSGAAGTSAGTGTVALGSGFRIPVIDAVPVGTDAFDGITLVLLRPDGYIAWAGNDESGLSSALERWFGAPGWPLPDSPLSTD
jgi:2-polyprenyl-6-methoxyphenol hydroxylase-like FAD-dependent oxidoreductase